MMQSRLLFYKELKKMLARGSRFTGQNDFVCGCRKAAVYSFQTTNNVKRNIARF
jgi:hypothetical protein